MSSDASNSMDSLGVSELIKKKKLSNELPKLVANAVAISGRGDKEKSLIDLAKLTESNGSGGHVILIDCRDQSVTNVQISERRSLFSRMFGWFTRPASLNPNLLGK